MKEIKKMIGVGEVGGGGEREGGGGGEGGSAEEICLPDSLNGGRHAHFAEKQEGHCSVNDQCKDSARMT